MLSDAALDNNATQHYAKLTGCEEASLEGGMKSGDLYTDTNHSQLNALALKGKNVKHKGFRLIKRSIMGDFFH